MSLTTSLKLNAKNAFLGRRTNRKIVVFDIDDYGTVRLHSRQARENLERAGLKAYSHFDQVDCLESNDDLDALFQVLRSVRDQHGKPAKFTAYALPANIDFEGMKNTDYEEYRYELLPETLKKLGPDYNCVMDYWRQGIQEGLIYPEFHGREHFHVKLVMEKLRSRDHEVLTCFQNRCLARISPHPNSLVRWNCAFDFDELSENEEHASTIKDGLRLFEQVYQIKPLVFCPPGGSCHRQLFEVACQNGIRYIEPYLFQKEHQGGGKFKTYLTYTGKKAASNAWHLVRNCVFEPHDSSRHDHVASTLKQIEAAFRWKKPAIISSHRINFCGSIDEENRQCGLKHLQDLLHQTVKRWPDVEFMSTAEMAEALGL